MSADRLPADTSPLTPNKSCPPKLKEQMNGCQKGSERVFTRKGSRRYYTSRQIMFACWPKPCWLTLQNLFHHLVNRTSTPAGLRPADRSKNMNDNKGLARRLRCVQPSTKNQTTQRRLSNNDGHACWSSTCWPAIGNCLLFKRKWIPCVERYLPIKFAHSHPKHAERVKTTHVRLLIVYLLASGFPVILRMPP